MDVQVREQTHYVNESWAVSLLPPVICPINILSQVWTQVDASLQEQDMKFELLDISLKRSQQSRYLRDSNAPLI